MWLLSRALPELNLCKMLVTQFNECIMEQKKVPVWNDVGKWANDYSAAVLPVPTVHASVTKM